jgi:hypothetical protein
MTALCIDYSTYGQRGPLFHAFEQAANQPPAVTKEDFQDALVKFVVRNKLPISLVEDPTFQSLVNLAFLAQDEDVIELPKKDAFSDKVMYLHYGF